ncbi:MAG: hypothetical protein JNM17_31215 [Archangium sp.]|nr:hypothetical protein [Archangium sp.]
MALLDTLRSLAGSRREALVWDCSNRNKLFAAAFELHEVAMHAGFSPDEATNLSLTLAELGTRAAKYERGGQASVFLRPDGWRVEMPAADVPTALVTNSNGRTTLRVVTRSDGDEVAIAEYARVVPRLS